MIHYISFTENKTFYWLISTYTNLTRLLWKVLENNFLPLLNMLFISVIKIVGIFLQYNALWILLTNLLTYNYFIWKISVIPSPIAKRDAFVIIKVTSINPNFDCYLHLTSSLSIILRYFDIFLTKNSFYIQCYSINSLERCKYVFFVVENINFIFINKMDKEFWGAEYWWLNK